MGNEDNARVLHGQLQVLHEKYDYWLMALAASGIALAVHETRELPLRYDMIPLAFAVVAWGTSILLGCWRQGFLMSAVHANLYSLDVADGRDMLMGRDPRTITAELDRLAGTYKDKSSWSGTCSVWQFRVLAVGALFYLAWHVIQMWLRT